MTKNKKSIILFDGLCKLCNRSLQFIIKRDKNKYFKLLPIESFEGQKLINELQIDIINNDSVIYIDNDIIRYRTNAILFILFKLNQTYYLLSFFLIIPSFLRDFFYNIIAKHRYRFFGKIDGCDY